MKENILKGKCLYTPKGAAREYAAVGCNFYRGCPYQCKYCYNKKGWTSKVMGVAYAVLENKFTDMKYRPKKYRNLSGEDYALTVFKHEVEKDLDYLRKVGIFFSFSTDPMCDECVMLTVKSALYALSRGIPVKILTKNVGWQDNYLVLFKELAMDKKQLVAFGFTLTGCDEWEPYSSSNQERVELMKLLHKAGFKTFASIEPIIEWDKSYKMFVDTLGYCDLYMFGTMSHFKDFYKFGTGTTFLANMVAGWIYDLQQLLDLKIYFKESYCKYMSSSMEYLYCDTSQQIVSPVTMDYDLFHEKPYNPLEAVTHALSFLNAHNGYLLGYVYKTDTQKYEDTFLLWKTFMLFGNTNEIVDYVVEQAQEQSESLHNSAKALLLQSNIFTAYLSHLGPDRRILYDTGDGKGEVDILPWLKVFSMELADIGSSIIDDLLLR